MKLKNKTYDTIKWICLTVAPALVLLLNTILPLYGVAADTIKVITITITALATFIGTVIGISSLQYAKGNCK